jgi:hypothetical protein
MARANVPFLLERSNGGGSETDAVLPLSMRVTLKHLSMFAIGTCELGDPKSGLALTAAPSASKYQSSVWDQNGVQFIYTVGVNVPIAGTAGRGNKAIALPSRAIASRFSLSSHNLSNAKRAVSLSG